MPLNARLRLESLEIRLVPADVSAPVILQWFDGSYQTIEERAADVFAAGYGVVYTPPPGRADSGDGSVGYDVYDRFDLGYPGRGTLYGTETGLKTAIDTIHRLGGTWTIDFVANHSGFSDLGTPGFANAGGYPGFAITLPGDIDGDYHGAFEGGDHNMRLAGLVDIAQEKNYQFIRSPVNAGDPNNIPAGTTPAFGRLANVPDANNRRLYPDRNLSPIFLFDPTTGESNIPVYPFNTANPLAGDAITENSMGLLMRNAQWLVQTIGVDGLRLDAAKHFPSWVLNFIDRAVYRANPRTMLDGSTNHVFSFSEVFDGNKAYLQSLIRKDINPSDPGRIGGNRDVLDFPLFFAMRDNLTGNGFTNDWRDIANASQDIQDDGLANNGSQGVAFAGSHDENGPYLSNVAHAYMLMRPGNAVVYFNAKEFGDGRDFPKDGRGDALGGLYGDEITTLVDIRNTHGRGNYIERWIEKEFLIFEREQSALVVLSNRLDGGFDSRTVQTAFAPGTHLIELTGNAGDPVVDPFNDFPEVLTVNGDGTVNLRVPRNRAPNGVEHGRGYFIYGVAGPQGSLSLTNVTQTLDGESPTTATNGMARLANIDVISSDSFQVRLDTFAVNLLGSIRDRDADGDNALLRIDSGLNVNGVGGVDYTSPGTPSYGFEEFVTTHDPGYFNADGDGFYAQNIDATNLAEGMHFITARAFRHREVSGRAVYTDFKRSVYVDRLPANSGIDSFNPIVAGVNENRRVVARSLDKTADNIHVFLDLPAAHSDADVIAMVGGGSQANKIDRDLWTKDLSGLTHGNHVLTTVTFEMSGRASLQRFSGLFTSTIFGAGLGDLDHDSDFDAGDVTLFRNVFESGDAQFNPAADFDGNGRVNNSDLIRYHERLLDVGANAITLSEFEEILGPALGGYATAEGSIVTLNVRQPSDTTPGMSFSWDLDNDSQFDDATGVGATVSWNTLQAAGIIDNGNYPIAIRVSDGATATVFTSNLQVANTAPTANLASVGTRLEHTAITLQFKNALDPATADNAAGFRYSYDFNNDGDFHDVGEIADSPLPTRQFTFNREGNYRVHGVVRDKDGGARDVYAFVNVRNADLIAVGTAPGPITSVRVLDTVSGAVRFTLLPFEPGYRGGAMVATGDVTGDRIPDIVVGAATGRRTSVRVFNGLSGIEMVDRRFEAFTATATNGVSIAVGDVNGDGVGDIIAGAGPSGRTMVRVFSGATNAAIGQIDIGGNKGVRVAAGDVNGDGRADIVVAPTSGISSVRIFNGATLQLLRSVNAFNGFAGGLFVAAGDLDGDGLADLIVSQDSATNARVRIFRGMSGVQIGDFVPFAGTTPQPRGASVAAIDRDGDGRADLIVGTGRGPAARLRTYRGMNLTLLGELSPFDVDLTSGVFVG